MGPISDRLTQPDQQILQACNDKDFVTVDMVPRSGRQTLIQDREVVLKMRQVVGNEEFKRAGFIGSDRARRLERFLRNVADQYGEHSVIELP